MPEKAVKRGGSMSKRVWLTVAIFATTYAAMAFHFEDKPGEWWTMRSAAMYGGKIGGGVGGLAGILGATAGFMVCRGKGRGFIVGSLMFLTMVGIGSLAAGMVALATAQPWHVKYPLLLMGTILTVVCGSNTWMVRRMYAQVEMRKMAAKEA
jgi:hypothetical protein